MSATTYAAMLERTVNESQLLASSRLVTTSLVSAVSTCQPKLSASGSPSLLGRR